MHILIIILLVLASWTALSFALAPLIGALLKERARVYPPAYSVWVEDKK